MKDNLNFGQVTEYLSQGALATRASWGGEIKPYVFLQLAVSIEPQFFDKINHVPPILKDLAKSKGLPLIDNFHLCMLFPDNSYQPYFAATVDQFANDWMILEAADVVPVNENEEMQGELPLDEVVPCSPCAEECSELTSESAACEVTVEGDGSGWIPVAIPPVDNQAVEILYCSPGRTQKDTAVYRCNGWEQDPERGSYFGPDGMLDTPSFWRPVDGVFCPEKS